MLLHKSAAVRKEGIKLFDFLSQEYLLEGGSGMRVSGFTPYEMFF
jgi:hypothetical protein